MIGNKWVVIQQSFQTIKFSLNWESVGTTQMLKFSWLIFKNLCDYICKLIYCENGIWNQLWFEIKTWEILYFYATVLALYFNIK